ncbi:hypothetical protein EYZ11_000722 [Aspergillus tanneri]|uniref:Glycoside hydrolase family 13 N-terminal domain-containing protein n=1 Tax=Aspergillus tanneri TaxID=1220188 RepID=A0A4S3JWE0_9EURO|nr:hypothetical protein EYZ11_000722 [Aspergillus tanneri]
MASQAVPRDGTGVIELDPWLEPFREALQRRFRFVESWVKAIDETEEGLEKYSRGYERFGLNVDANGNITYREWAPNALEAQLVGDFSISAHVDNTFG